MKSAFFKIIIVFAFLSISTSCTFFEKLLKKPQHTGPNVKVTTKELNVRLEPNDNSKVLTIVMKDSILNLVEPIDSKTTWCKIEYNNQVGYCSTKYVEPYTQTSNLENFFIIWGAAFVCWFLLIRGIKYKIKDGRYSGGTRDGGPVYTILQVLSPGLILGLITTIFLFIYLD